VLIPGPALLDCGLASGRIAPMDLCPQLTSRTTSGKRPELSAVLRFPPLGEQPRRHFSAREHLDHPSIPHPTIKAKAPVCSRPPARCAAQARARFRHRKESATTNRGAPIPRRCGLSVEPGPWPSSLPSLTRTVNPGSQHDTQSSPPWEPASPRQQMWPAATLSPVTPETRRRSPMSHQSARPPPNALCHSLGPPAGKRSRSCAASHDQLVRLLSSDGSAFNAQ